MSDDILKQGIIAAHLSTLYKEVRELKRAKRLKDREEELSISEPPNNRDHVGESRFDFDVCLVTSLIDDDTFLVDRAAPTTSNAVGWVADTEFTDKPLVVTKSPNGSLPTVGDAVPVFFTGMFDLASVPTPRYGYFATAAGASPFAHYRLNAADSISDLGTTTVNWLIGDEIENVGSGFVLDSTDPSNNPNFKILAAADGKLVRIEVGLKFDCINDWSALKAALLRDDVEIAGQTQQAPTDYLTAPSAHFHDRLNGWAEDYVTFGHTFRANLDELYRVDARQSNSQSQVVDLMIDSWITLRVVSD